VDGLADTAAGTFAAFAFAAASTRASRAARAL
jgi:hypothetical protein